MEDDNSKNLDSQAKQSEKTEYDPSLDFFSEHFDPLKALATPGIVPPVLDATVHDNIAKYKSAHSEVIKKNVSKAGSSKSSVGPSTLPPQRNWLPHQLPVPSKRTRKPKNVLIKMESATGPLGLLKRCKDERIQIKVITRNSHTVRGYCTGFVTAFDRFCNMVLEDVSEIWTRPTRRKIPGGMGEEIKITKNHLLPPPVTIIKADKKTETCKRHVDQLIVRGEQVVLVAVESPNCDNSKD